MKYGICLLSFLLLASGCSGQNNNPAGFAKELQPAIAIQRFDKEFHAYLQNPSPENQKNLQARYAGFLPAFGRITINNSDAYKPEFYTRLKTYFSNEMLAKIYDDALKTFENVSVYEQELLTANNFVAAEFAGKQLPAFYLHVSGFKENVMALDGIISVSADKYLGSDYPAYKQFFEPYQLIQMQPELISRDYLKAWLLSDMLATKKNPNLLDEMINEGKLLYALSKLLPDWRFNDLIAYTGEQENWCNDNEQKIWQTIVKSNHLYNQDRLLIGKYINDAPYTATLTTDSPGRAGAWVGWRIVSAYVSKNNVPLSQLLATDSQSLLKGSAYNP
ncbi:gliding motility lipoprotein GldB [Viscerimonas tarda]